MNYRETRSSYENCEKRIFSGVGSLDIPSINPIRYINPDSFSSVIGFNYAIGEKKPGDKIVHFYLDDYQIRRVWDNPDRYIPILQNFSAVLSPDFSLYTDFPRAIQIYNHYRKQWLGAYWQEHGITVIPTICWSDEESYNWCFDGIPKESAISISTVGGFGKRKGSNKEAWLRGYYQCLEVLQPSQILLHGRAWPEIDFPCPVIYLGDSHMESKKTNNTKNIRSKCSFFLCTLFVMLQLWYNICIGK